MRTVADIVNEIIAIKGSVAKRKEMHGDIKDMSNKMAQQIARAITNLELQQLDIKASELLYDAIATAGLDEASTSLMTAAVDMRLDSHLDEETSNDAKGNQQTQHLLHPEHWMTEDLYSLAGNDSTSFRAKLQAGADYLGLCGIRAPNEKTVGMWLAFFVCQHFDALPDYHVIFDHLTEFKSMIHGYVRRGCPFPVIYNYPKSPEQLPKLAYTHIFGDDLTPMQVSVPRLMDVFTNHIPLRKTSKLLQKKSQTAHDAVMLREDATPKRTTKKSGEALSSSSCSKVKSEPEDSLEQTAPASPAAEASHTPAWAVELMNSLRETNVKMPAQVAPTIKSAMSDLKDGPAWALELHQLLECACNAAKTEEPRPENKPSAMSCLKKKLCPKGNLSLRLTDPAGEEAAQPEATSGQTNADTERTPTAAYELVATEALKSVKAKRAERAAEKKRINKEAQLQKTKEKDEQRAKAEKAKPGAKVGKAGTGAKKAGKTEQGAKDADQEAAGAMKRPAAAALKRPAAAKALKRPAAAVVEEYTPENPPSCPPPEDKTPIEYNGGKIYNTTDKFRVLRKANDAYTEKSFAHKKWGREGGFRAGLKAVDDCWDAVRIALQNVKAGEDVD